MSAFVVDTNVPVVANGRRTPQADVDCIMACVDALTNLQAQGMVVLDEGMLILREYMDNLNMSGQPGVGDAFLKWVWSIQADSRHCERVRITPRTDRIDEFEEFPDDSDLEGFDLADRKFVAVARASQGTAGVLNAVDRDWWDYRDALNRHGVDITFLCPQIVGTTQ